MEDEESAIPPTQSEQLKFGGTQLREKSLNSHVVVFTELIARAELMHVVSLCSI